MFNWFKKKEIVENPIEITVAGINPQTENEFLFYDFVENEFHYHLKKWYEKAKSNGVVFKPKYEKAVRQKIDTKKFKNPHSFPEYFDNKFDYIAIDFETANKNRISACAIGLVFIKDYRIAYSTKYLIKPPENEKFDEFNIGLHGITYDDIEFADNFLDLWNNELSKYFNDNLVIFHNASMDLSILKNLFNYFSIKNFEITYLDTMLLADKLGLPKKISELTDYFEIEYLNHHDPTSDAKACALVYNELIDLYKEHKSLRKKLSFNTIQEGIQKKALTNKLRNENLNNIQIYSINKDELDKIIIQDKGFIFTGNLNIERSVCKEFIKNNGGIIKSSVTSKVDFVVLGVDFGWAKIKKVNELNTTKNCEIKILSNSDFEYLMNKNATQHSITDNSG